MVVSFFISYPETTNHNIYWLYIQFNIAAEESFVYRFSFKNVGFFFSVNSFLSWLFYKTSNPCNKSQLVNKHRKAKSDYGILSEY